MSYSIGKRIPLPYQEEYLLLVEERIKHGDLNCAFGFRFHAEIDREIMEKTIRKIVENNDAFRMRIINEDGKYFQYCEESTEYVLRVTMPEGSSAEERYNAAYAEAMGEIKKLIPIGSENPLWKCWMYKIDNDDYFMVFNLHHAISDGYSASILTELLKKYYAAIKNNEEIESASGASGYMEFIENELELSGMEKGQKQLQYWADEIEGYKPLDLSEFIKDENPEMAKKIVNIDLASIDSAAKKAKSSHFAVLMTAYHIAISKLTGVHDTLIGFASANRTDKKFRNTIGFLSRAVQNRLMIKDDDSLNELVSTTFRKISENVANQSMMITGRDDNSKSIIQFHCTYSPTVLDGKNMIFDGKPYETIQFIVEHRVDFLTAMVYEHTDHIMLLFVADTCFVGSELIEKISSAIPEIIDIIDRSGDLKYSELKLWE